MGVVLPQQVTSGVISGYTLADVPRLAEYSASVYASNPVEHAHYVQYYTDYYTTEISKNSGDPQLTEANSGAAVALSAIQRKQRKVGHVETTTSVPEAKAAFLARGASAPRGNDGKKYRKSLPNNLLITLTLILGFSVFSHS